MKVIVRDRNQSLIDALNHYATVKTMTMAGVDIDHIDYEFVCDDILALPADVLVSPANSFGYMDGGVDRVYCDRIGWHLQTDIQKAIRTRTKFGELLVGDALDITTGEPRFPVMVAAPTMRLPGRSSADNVYIATRAATALSLELKAKTMVMPGMGTGIGGVPVEEAATAILHGFRTAFKWAEDL